MDQQIIYYYKRGVASYLIAKKFGISNTKVRDILTKNGIKLRSHNITNKVSAAKRTPEENHAITQAASAHNRGSQHSEWHRRNLAVSRQLNPTIDPVYEAPLMQLCEKRRIDVIPQKAFYKYNVDLFLPDQSVVIELFGGNFHNKPQAVKLFKNKFDYLSSKNIPVVVVWADKLTFNPQAVLDVALRAKNKLTIIEGSGVLSRRGLADIILDD